jgi:hypothetical protein
MSRENIYQAKLIKKLEAEFPGCIVVKNDSSYIQGIPDLTVYFDDRWVWLEVKKDAKSVHQPNQDHYVDLGKRKAYASFIYPENETQVFDEIRRYLNDLEQSQQP